MTTTTTAVRSLLCPMTVAALDGGVKFPPAMLAKANGEFHAARQHSRTKRRARFLWHDVPMCFTTTLVVLEQLFRHQHRVDIIAEQACGEFGLNMVRMQIGASSSGKRRTKTTTGKADDSHKTGQRRTKCGVSRNVWDLEPIIHETACCVLFGGVSDLRILAPSHWGDGMQGSGRYVYRTIEVLGKKVRVKGPDGKPICEGILPTTNKEFVCFEPATGEFVSMVAQITNEEFAMLDKVIQHNSEQSDAGNPNGFQYMSMNSEESPKLCKQFGKKVLKANRLLQTLRRAPSGCVWMAFSASMARVIDLEFGHNRQVHELLSTERHDKMGDTNIDMVPVLFADHVAKHCTPLQRAILEMDVTTVSIDKRDKRDKLDEMLWRLNNTLDKPISRATFFRERSKILELCGEFIKADD